MRRRILENTIGPRARERPQCRKQIIKHHLRPRLEDGRWDGTATELESGNQRIFLSDGMRKQMGKMLWEGYWPKREK
ncbi:MAG: hypothetical protein ABSA41_17020 [Terriglobia bacterium]|jgi:hypothetical protein